MLIKELFVGLGVKINSSQFNALTSKLKELDSTAEKITNKTARNVALASVTVASFLATVAGGVAAFLGGLAESDIEIERFAKRMWMTEENARSLKIALDAMGMSMSDLEDIAMNAELRSYLMALREESKQLSAPDELQDQLQNIREVRFEFMRLRQIVAYGSQWVGYYLMKYLEQPITRLKSSFKDLNEYLKNNMQNIAERIAFVLSKIVGIAYGLADAVAKVVVGINNFWSSLTPGEKAASKFGASIAGIALVLVKLNKTMPWISKLPGIIGGLFMKLTPLGRVVSIVLALIGAMSTVQGMAKGETPFSKVFGDKALAIAFGDAVKSVIGLFEQLYEIYLRVDNIFRKATGMGIFEAFLTGIKKVIIDTLNAITLIVDGITWLLDKFNAIQDFFFGNNTNAGNIGSRGMFTPGATSYNGLQPTAFGGSNNTRVITSNMSPTYNIYGSNATSVANEANRLNTTILRTAFASGGIR